MADEKRPEEIIPRAPVLLFPKEGVIDSRQLRLVWQKVDTAKAYFVEVASDTHFESVVFEQNVGEANNIQLEQVLPPDGQTYYWRVFAWNDNGWSEGENISSFISATEEEAASQPASPDADEEFGPAARLFRGAAVEVAADLSDSEAMLRSEIELGVAHEGVEAKQIMGLVIAVIAALIVIVLIIINYATAVTGERQRSLSAGVDYPLLEETERRANEQLTQYQVIDEETGRYRIPIDRAMQLMVEESGAVDGSVQSPSTQ